MGKGRSSKQRRFNCGSSRWPRRPDQPPAVCVTQPAATRCALHCVAGCPCACHGNSDCAATLEQKLSRLEGSTTAKRRHHRSSSRRESLQRVDGKLLGYARFRPREYCAAGCDDMGPNERWTANIGSRFHSYREATFFSSFPLHSQHGPHDRLRLEGHSSPRVSSRLPVTSVSDYRGLVSCPCPFLPISLPARRSRRPE